MTTATTTPTTYLRPAEVAELLGVNTKTVGTWARAGKLPSVRTLGGHRRYDEARIRALAAELSAALQREGGEAR